jgi:TatD DNase family protein
MFVDSHCHIDSSSYDNIDEVIERARENNVKMLIVNGYDRKSNHEIIELVKKYDIVYGALGWQPSEIDDIREEDFEFLENHINDDKIVAIGEIGLDYYYEEYDKNKQIEVFKRQLSIANKYSKPVIIHSRESIQDTYNILKEKKARGVIHCYSGSLEMAREFIKVGFCLGIGGICTFRNANNIIRVIENVPLEYIVLETDSPYLTPEPYRGKKNEPMYIPVIAKKVADIKSLDIKEVMEVTTVTVGRIFDKND